MSESRRAKDIEEQALDPEEHFVLRVRDANLAERIRSTLQNSDDSTKEPISVVFDGKVDTGTFKIGNQAFPLSVLNLPCVLESYKTFDDTNLVKTTDVGQMLVVGDAEDLKVPGEPLTGFDNSGFQEAMDGITPPFFNVRERIFRKPIDVPENVVQRVERDLLIILGGGAPVKNEMPGSINAKFIDVEEVWQINPQTGQGEWVAVKSNR